MEPNNSSVFNYHGFKERLTQELGDPIFYEPLDKASTLPCGHNFNESTIAKMNKLCSLCRAPFETSCKNTTIRNLVEIANLLPEEMKDHTEEAEMLFGNAKALCRDGKIEQAIALLSEVLDLCPNYQEAIGYNACLLDMLPKVPSKVECQLKQQFITKLDRHLDELVTTTAYSKDEAELVLKAIQQLKGSKELNKDQQTHLTIFNFVFDLKNKQMEKLDRISYLKQLITTFPY